MRGNAKEEYLKYKICDEDISIEIKFLKNNGDYRTGDEIKDGVFVNSYGLIYIIDKEFNLKMIRGKILEDFIIEEKKE